MDLPPSGWYPDPYGTPDLLRWWDGLTWTHHTHPFVTDGSGGAGGSAGAASGGMAAGGALQATTVQGAASGLSSESALSGNSLSSGLSAQATTVQAATGGTGGWAARDSVIDGWAGTDWPTGEQLAATKPPNGPRTEPQPALPSTPGLSSTGLSSTTVQSSVQSSAAATRYQAAVQATSVQQPVAATTYQGAVPATAVQQPVGGGWGASGVAPTTVQGAAGQQGGGAGVDGTQVLFLGNETWNAPNGADSQNPYGYQEAQRRRKMWLIGGVSAGVAVAIGIIVVVANSMGGSPSTTAADQTQVSTPPAAPTSPAAAASPSMTASPTPSTSVTPVSVLSDSQSGLSYSQLGSPWQGGCPTSLNSAFPWTAGESAIAGQINGGQMTWYGEACSGPLPAQYGYTGPQDLDNAATNVASTLGNAYYQAIAHTSTPVLSQPTSVSGHAAWEIEYQINYTNPSAQGATFTTEMAAVVVADTGTGNTPVVFFSSVPNTLGTTTVSSLVSSLQLNPVPNPSASADAGGSPAPGGSPGD